MQGRISLLAGKKMTARFRNRRFGEELGGEAEARKKEQGGICGLIGLKNLAKGEETATRRISDGPVPYADTKCRTKRGDTPAGKRVC